MVLIEQNRKGAIIEGDMVTIQQVHYGSETAESVTLTKKQLEELVEMMQEEQE